MRLFLLSFLNRLVRGWLAARGVQLGAGGWIHGVPELRMARGSRVVIGNNVTLCSLSSLNPLAPGRRLSLLTHTPEAQIVIHDGAGISNSVLSCFDRISVGRHTLIGAECLIVDSDFHGLPLGENRPTRTAPVEIGENVFIGTRSIILKGVRIGDKAVIGAGSVVTADVPAGCLAAGNPACVIRSFAAEAPASGAGI